MRHIILYTHRYIMMPEDTDSQTYAYKVNLHHANHLYSGSVFMINCSHEFRVALYNLFTFYVSSIVLLAYNLSQYKAKKVLLSKFSNSILSHYSKNPPHPNDRLLCCLTVLEIMLISLFQHGLVAILNTFLGDLLSTGKNYFGMIFAMPVLLPLYCWLFGINPFKQIDLITPAYPLALFFLKLGCFCIGCCGGIVCKFGLMSYRTNEVEFPVQLLEACIALFLFLFLHFHRKRAKEGTLLPTYVVLYCATRFLSEFLCKEPAVFGSLNVYHILCLVGIFIGFVQLVFLKKYRYIIDCIFLHDLPYFLAKPDKKVK